MKTNIVKYFSILLYLLLQANLVGQYTFDWAQTYGGDAWDEAFNMVETANGDLLLCGYTKLQEKHLWIIKIDEKGKSRWGKTYKARPVSEARDILIASDSSIIAVGYSVKPFAYNSDLWILKLNQFGEKIWDKNFGGVADEKAYGVVETYDRGYAMAGVTTTTENFQEDAWVLKVDSMGQKVWEMTFGGKKPDYANDIIETSDKGLVVCGMTSSYGDGYKSIWVAKMDSSGLDIWDNTYRVNKWDVGTSLVEGLDGYIYVAGYTRTFSIIDYDVVLLKLDQDGNLIWKKVFSWGRWDQATSISTTFDNGIVVGGFSRSGKVLSSDFAVSKFDSAGNNLWENIFARKSLDYSNKVLETRDNGLAITGTTYMQGRGWDFALLKYKNDDLPEISFYQDSVATSIHENYTLRACVSTKSNLKNIQVYFNDSLFVDHAKKNENRAENLECDIPLNVDLQLVQGFNKIDLILTDYKNHQTKSSCKVYFIPPTEEHW